MATTILKDIPTALAWTFSSVLPGTFQRDKKAFAGIDFPILAPLPPQGSKTAPVEQHLGEGPYVYFVSDAAGRLCYVGKSLEKTVLKRWIRPGLGGPASHYWSHTNKTAGCVRKIADGVRTGNGPYTLRYTTLQAARTKLGGTVVPDVLEPKAAIKALEDHFIATLKPAWNIA